MTKSNSFARLIIDSSIILLILIGSAHNTLAQFEQDLEFVKITFHNGESISGILQEKSEGHITILKGGVSNRIARADIKILREITDSSNNEDYIEIRNTNYADQYHITQSAFGAPKGQLYARNTTLAWNQLQYGISDYFSVGIAFDNISLIAFQESPLVGLTTKFNTNFDKWNVAAGAILLGQNDEGVSILFGTVTYGSRANNISAGVLYVRDRNDFEDSIKTYSLSFKISDLTKISFKGEVLYSISNSYIYTSSLNYNFGNKMEIGLGLLGSIEERQKIPLLIFTIPLSESKK